MSECAHGSMGNRRWDEFAGMAGEKAVQSTMGVHIGTVKEGTLGLDITKAKNIDLLGMIKTDKQLNIDACNVLAAMVNMERPRTLIASSNPAPKESYLPRGTLTIMKPPNRESIQTMPR